jgi:Flp pilus assembly protein TadB
MFMACPTCGGTMRAPDGTEIRIEGTNAHEVEKVFRGAVEDHYDRQAAAQRVGPWASGAFYLLAFLLVVAVLAVVANVVPIWALPPVLVAGLLGVSVIGALQLRHDRRLSERGFLRLMALTLRQLPLVGNGDPTCDERPEPDAKP